ncbi:hypothetical protein EBU71_16145 [bacterium]|nr:hypothetical protein [Candidatus Elulimicrobium humile]
MKFEIPEIKVIDKSKATVDYLSGILSTLKQEYDYEIDGLVLADNSYHKENVGENPKYTVAFKHNIETTTATVVDVLWEASRYGLLKPRIQIEPVDLNGVKITYLTGFHGQYIKENKIGKNTVLQICRSGDVIPHILSVVKSTEAKFPPKEEYEWTDSVDIRTKLNTDDNLSVKMAYFLGICGAKGVKEGEPNRFVIRNKKTHLNIVCQLEPGDNEFKLTVITVMRKEDFRSYHGQFVVELKS